MNITHYVWQNRITVEVERDRGAQADESGWEHHAYVLTLVWGDGGDGSLSRRMTNVPWMQGYGVADSPTDRPDMVLDALVSDASSYMDARSFKDWAESLGYDTDSRKAEATYRQCGDIAKRLADFLGSRDELERVAYKIERL